MHTLGRGPGGRLREGRVKYAVAGPENGGTGLESAAFLGGAESLEGMYAVKNTKAYILPHYSTLPHPLS